MFDIPTILTSEELLQKAFRRASRVRVSDPDFRFRMQKLNKAKVDSLASVVDSTLEKYVKAFPSFNNLAPFYRALIDLLEPIDDIRRILGRIDGARKQIISIQKKTIRQINRTSKTAYMDSKRNEAFGRISSMVRDLDDDLKRLNKIREKFKTLPSISTKNPTVVVAGFPSVGKSQLVKAISTADPKVASYPFTTQELTVGYFDERRTRYQIVDTPGLLDRSFDERNRVEKQAILALTLLTKTCLFMVDPTGHCGYTLEPQLYLMKNISESIPEMKLIVLLNKSDLPLPDGVSREIIEEGVRSLGDRVIAVLDLSASTGEGMDSLKKMVIDTLIEDEDKPWENFQDPLSVQ
jgi:nucleolar GTP-binding protein